MSDTDRAIKVSNAEFLHAIYGELSKRERYWISAFSCTPEEATAQKKWGGRAAMTVQDYPGKNAYVSTATLAVIKGAIRKSRSYFSSLPLVVVDDVYIDKCSYALETSQGNFQVGFILRDPIRNEEKAARLQTALGRQKLFKADKNGYSSIRYVRLPVASNNKSNPPWQCRLTKWQPALKFTLEEIAGIFNLPLDYILYGKAGVVKQSAVPMQDTALDVDDIEADPDRVETSELVTNIVTGESLHTPIASLSARLTGWGVPELAINEIAKGLMLAAPDQHEDRWKSRFADIPRVVRTAIEKYGPNARGWPSLVNPFAEYVVPPFPMDTLPRAFSRLCKEHAEGSGFDPGAYAFAMLVGAASLIDHRARYRAGSVVVPAYLWGGLAGGSGAGKSPVMSAALAGIRKLDAEEIAQSNSAAQSWLSAKGKSGGKPMAPPQPKPKWRQIIVRDTTVEALATLLQDNPEGVLVHHEEITEFIGRMDAYSNNGSGKDRGVYLRAFDGGPETVHRASKEVPTVIEHFSVGILAGIQPEKLAELFKKSAGSSDGLFQRFLMYGMQPSGKVDYSKQVQPQTKKAAEDLLRRVRERNDNLFGLGDGDAELCAEAVPLMQEYHQSMRNLANQTASERLKEHLNKFPGFLARITFVLHRLDCAEREEASEFVSLVTFAKAKRIMDCLYTHSNAIYEVLDQQSGEVSRLVKSACEAILAKGWQQVQRRDLTQYATGWRDGDTRAQENAIALLEEFGWWQDVTPVATTGKKGRRSLGVFAVNPLVHQTFASECLRIQQARAERHAAIQALAQKRAAEGGSN